MTYLGPDQSSDVLVKSSRQGMRALTTFGAAAENTPQPFMFPVCKVPMQKGRDWGISVH